MKKKTKTKENVGQGALFENSGPTFCYTAEDDKVTQATKFLIERHMIYLKRSLKKPAPWTNDYALRNGRFCNIYRQLDTVSLWIYKNVILPNSKNPNLPVLLALSRVINWPDTIQTLIDDKVWPVEKFNKDKFYRSLQIRKDAGNKIVTGAYIVNTVYPKGFIKRDPSKIGYIADVAATRLWESREILAQAGKSKHMEKFVDALLEVQGFGSFMAYQTVVDLSYSKAWLYNAKDKNTFVSPGPGTRRGLNRYFTGTFKPTLNKDDHQKLLIQLRGEVNAKLRKLVPSKLWTDDFRTGFAEIEMSNVHNLLCEFDKHQRVFYGEGRMKNKYKG